MYILCSGNTSDTLSSLINESSNLKGIGIKLDDFMLTIKNRGYSHFDSVEKIIITDGALDTLMDVTVLNEIANLKGKVYFINRFTNITNTTLLDDRIKNIDITEITLEDLKQVLLREDN